MGLFMFFFDVLAYSPIFRIMWSDPCRCMNSSMYALIETGVALLAWSSYSIIFGSCSVAKSAACLGMRAFMV